MGSDDTKDRGKKPAASAPEGEHGVWQDLARMEAELTDPEEEATQLFTRDDLAELARADGRSALAIALARGAPAARAPDEAPASVTLPVDDGPEDETLHHDPEGDEEIIVADLEADEESLLHDLDSADETHHLDLPAEPADEVDLGSTVALDAELPDLSFDAITQAATGLAATVAFDPSPAPAVARPPPAASAKAVTEAALAKVALAEAAAVAAARAESARAEAALAKVARAEAALAQAARAEAVERERAAVASAAVAPAAAAPPPAPPPRPAPPAGEDTMLSRPPGHKPSDYLLAGRPSTAPPRRRHGDAWMIVLVVALLALAASLALLWMAMA